MANVLITGCSRGLGYHLNRQFFLEGHSVYPHTRTKEQGGYITGELTDQDTIADIIECIANCHINIFINNASVYYKSMGDTLFDNDTIHDVIDVNFSSQLALLKEVYTYLNHNHRKNSLIVNVSSLAAKFPSANESVYCATKAGINSYLKCLQLESSPKNLKFLDVYIGAMKTDMSKHRNDYDTLIDPKEVSKCLYNIINSTLNYNTMYINEITIRKI